MRQYSGYKAERAVLTGMVQTGRAAYRHRAGFAALKSLILEQAM